jgi:hypothetical protein
MDDGKIFYLVWREQGGAPTRKHDSLLSARREAERLASQYGDEIHVLASVGTAICRKVDWVEHFPERQF